MTLQREVTGLSGQQRSGHTGSVDGPAAEAQLLSRADARSGGALCTDAMKPVLFKIERVKED